MLGVHAGSHHSGRGQRGAGKYHASAAISWETPAKRSAFA
jgi:hypothetical protein